MDPIRFDALARQLGTRNTRRSLLRGTIAAIAATLGLSQISTSATGATTLTIHNATCGKDVSNRAIYEACHDNRFGCTDFFFRNRSIRTSKRGIAFATVAAGSLTLTQQARAVDKSDGIWVYCSANSNRRILYSGRADGGSVTLAIRRGDQVICDWYNYTRTPFSFPGQCSVATTTTTTTRRPTTTTAQPTTTTTTTTGIPCTQASDCPGAIEGCTAPACINGHCGRENMGFAARCDTGYCDGYGTCVTCASDLDCNQKFVEFVNTNLGLTCSVGSFCDVSNATKHPPDAPPFPDNFGFQVPTCGAWFCSSGACQNVDPPPSLGTSCGPGNAFICAGTLSPFTCVPCVPGDGAGTGCGVNDVCVDFNCQPATTGTSIDDAWMAQLDGPNANAQTSPFSINEISGLAFTSAPSDAIG